MVTALRDQDHDKGMLHEDFHWPTVPSTTKTTMFPKFPYWDCAVKTKTRMMVMVVNGTIIIIMSGSLSIAGDPKILNP